MLQFGGEDIDFDFDFEHVLDDYLGELVSSGDGVVNPFKRDCSLNLQQTAAASAGSCLNDTLMLV